MLTITSSKSYVTRIILLDVIIMLLDVDVINVKLTFQRS